MNAFLSESFGLQTIVDTPVWVLLLFKLTAILSAAWLAHLALARANPRWRVFLWRMTAVGLIALPAVSLLLPAMELRILPSPFGRGAGGEGGSEGGGVVVDKQSSEILPAPNIDQRFVESWAGGNVSGEVERAENDIVPHDALTLALSRRERGPLLTIANTKTLLLAVWLGGIAILALRLCIGHYRICRIGGRVAKPPQWICDGCLRVARAIGCPAHVEVLQSTEVPSPFLCGLRRPRLLLPVRMCDDAYHVDLPGIFAHELTHVRSHDLFWNAALHLISIVFWFHPLAWRIRKAHLASCELVCDAVSANFVGDVTEYCRTLARVAVDARIPLPAAGIAMARVSNISHRLSVLKRCVFDLPLRRRQVILFGCIALSALATLGMLRFAAAEPETPASTAVRDKKEPLPSKPIVPSDQKATTETSDAERPAAVEGVVVEGTITDPSGKPASGAAVGLYAELGDSPRTTTDQNGHYQFVVAKRGDYVLAVVTSDLARISQRLTVGSKPKRFDFQLLKAEPIRLQVVDEDGRPMPDVKVNFRFGAEDRNACILMLDYQTAWKRGQPWNFTTDAEGRWSRLWIPGDELRLIISKPGCIRVDAKYAPSEQEHVVTLKAGGWSVAGRVVDAEKKTPITKFRVTEGHASNPAYLA